MYGNYFLTTQPNYSLYLQSYFDHRFDLMRFIVLVQTSLIGFPFLICLPRESDNIKKTEEMYLEMYYILPCILEKFVKYGNYFLKTQSYYSLHLQRYLDLCHYSNGFDS